MKKILLLITLVITCNCFQAQTVRMGPFLGYNYTSLTNSNIITLGNQLGYLPTYCWSFGATGVYNIDESLLGFEGGLIYASHNQSYLGTEITGPGTYYQISVETKLKYLDIPILFRLGDIKGFHGEIVPQFSFLMSSNSSVSYNPSDSAHLSSSGAYGGDFSGFGFSGILGGGFTFMASKTVFVDFGVRMSYGFTDVTNQFNQGDSSVHSFTGTYANYTKFNYNSTNNFGYTSTSRISYGVYFSLTFLIEGDTKFNKRFR